METAVWVVCNFLSNLRFQVHRRWCKHKKVSGSLETNFSGRFICQGHRESKRSKLNMPNIDRFYYFHNNFVVEIDMTSH